MRGTVEPVDSRLGDRPADGGAVVQTAVPVAASETGNPNGDFCKVTGIVKPKNPSSPNLRVRGQPAGRVEPPRAADGRRRLRRHARDRPHGFTLQPANVDNPLKQGFVTLGSDGGHKSAAGFDGSFAHGRRGAARTSARSR